MRFCQCLLFIFNFLFFICGIALCAAGGYVLATPYLPIPKVETGVGLAIFLIVLGALIFIFGFFGCCGAIKESPCMLNTFAVLLALVLLLQFAGGITAFVKRNAIKDAIKKEFVDSMIPKYVPGGNDTVTEAWDGVQTKLKCCGYVGPDDWKLNTVLPSGSVPDSCCRNNTEGCGENWKDKPKGDIRTIGCKDKVLQELEIPFYVIGGVAIGLAFIEVVGIIMACCLSQSIKNDEFMVA